MGEEIGKVTLSIESGAFLKVRENPTLTAKIIGYTKRVEGNTEGVEVWGDSFESSDEVGRAGETDEGESLARWVMSDYLLWDKVSCDPEESGDCENSGYMVARDDDNLQVTSEGYVAELAMSVTPQEEVTHVLGVSTEESDGSLPVVEVASESAALNQQNVERVEVKSSSEKQVVVNRSVLQLLNISENEAIGKQIDLSMVVVGELLDDPNKRIESAPLMYTIVGVITDEGTPIIYVPFVDVRSLGVNKFSQAKVIVNDTK